MTCGVTSRGAAPDEGPRVVALVGGQRHPLPAAPPPVEHHQSRLALRRPRRLADEEVEDQPIAVLHEDVPRVAEARLLPLAFACEPRLGVGPRDVRLVRPLLAVEVDVRIPPAALAGRVAVSRGRTLFSEAQACSSVPSTVKWSSEMSRRAALPGSLPPGSAPPRRA